MKWVWMGLAALLLTVVYGAWRNNSKQGYQSASPPAVIAQPPAAKAAVQRSDGKPNATAAKAALSPPPGEPPEDVLVGFQKAVYEAINRAGGMRVALSANGNQTVLKPKLYSARKTGCRLLPNSSTAFECTREIPSQVPIRAASTRDGTVRRNSGGKAVSDRADKGSRLQQPSRFADTLSLGHEICAAGTHQGHRARCGLRLRAACQALCRAWACLCGAGCGCDRAGIDLAAARAVCASRHRVGPLAALGCSGSAAAI
jgi:hypothetical protein